MNLRELYKIFLFGLILYLLVACTRENPTPTLFPETPAPQTTTPEASTPTPPETELANISTPAVSSSPNEAISELGSFIPSIAADSVSGETNEKIVEKLLSQWLDYFKKTIASDSPARLEEYEIREVKVRSDLQYLVEEMTGAFVAEMTFSVKPAHSPSPDWLAGNGKPIDDNNWINDKSLFAIVMKSEDFYILDFWGTSP